MKFKVARQQKKQRKFNSRNAIELKRKIVKAVSEGFTDYALVLEKRALRRGYVVRDWRKDESNRKNYLED